MSNRPLNKQVIVFYYSGVSKGLFGKGDYVTTLDIREACERENCPDGEEHLTFDGQIFFKQPPLYFKGVRT